jgi:light-regulated signal transduction histidine kinase (bacteriophytochrome)
MTSFAQLLARRYRDQRDAETQEYVGFIVQAALKIKRLLRDLLVYTKLDQPMVIQENVACERLIQDVLDQFRTAIAETSATITYDPLPMVNADPDRLGQVFTHLIDNALKFRNGDLPPQIHIAARKDNGAWRFSVRDNGVGIDSAYHARIFRVFERLNSQQAYAGTGIGLAICKKIIEGHGGRIWVASEVGKGTTFYFTLPASY